MDRVLLLFWRQQALHMLLVMSSFVLLLPNLMQLRRVATLLAVEVRAAQLFLSCCMVLL